MIVSTQTVTMQRTNLSLLGMKKRIWPDPQSSIDFKCGELSGVPCWTIKGAAQKLFNEIEDGIKKLLEGHMDDIEGCQLSLETLGWSMYMRGRDENHAEPVLLFECLDRKTRAKVVDIVKKSKLWKSIIKEHPALRLASSSRGPQGCGSAADIPDISDASDAVYVDGTLNRLCGVQIYVNLSSDPSSPSFCKATLGGVISVGDDLLGMTVAHLFKDMLKTQNSPEENNDEFTFEDDSEVEDDTFIDFTSRGSNTPRSTGSTLEMNDSLTESESNSAEDSNSLDMTLTMADDINTEMKSPVNVSAKTTLGLVKAKSLDYPSNTLDWAIIPIGGEYSNLPNSVDVPTPNGYFSLNIKRVADPEWTSDEVWAITASNGPVKGRLSTVPYHLKIAGSRTFQRTWMTCLEAEVAPGASGTWIIDRKSHELVGQVVARQPGSRLAYVVPASHIIKDIESRLGCYVSFPIARNNGMGESPENSMTMTLHQAAEKGYEGAIQRLLEGGADVQSTSRGQTALHLAAKNGHERVVQQLLDQGANIKSRTSLYKQTALHLAVKGGCEGVVRQLLEKGVNIESKDDFRQTALHLAAEGEHEGIMTILLNNYAKVESKDSLEHTALHLAAIRRHQGIVKLLLEKDVNIESRDSLGQTALHLAAQRGHQGIVTLLLQEGANIESEDQDGQTALHLAIIGRNEEGIVTLLLEKGANPESKNRRGQTALHLAAERGREGIVTSLLEKGVNIESKDLSDQTSLHLAAERGREGAITLLLEKGANIESENRSGHTALHLAAWGGHEGIVVQLLQKGASIGSLLKGRCISPALALAIKRRNEEDQTSTKDAATALEPLSAPTPLTWSTNGSSYLTDTSWSTNRSSYLTDTSWSTNRSSYLTDTSWSTNRSSYLTNTSWAMSRSNVTPFCLPGSELYRESQLFTESDDISIRDTLLDTHEECDDLELMPAKGANISRSMRDHVLKLADSKRPPMSGTDKRRFDFEADD